LPLPFLINFNQQDTFFINLDIFLICACALNELGNFKKIAIIEVDFLFIMMAKNHRLSFYIKLTFLEVIIVNHERTKILVLEKRMI
jgi:hypothetical protein